MRPHNVKTPGCAGQASGEAEVQGKLNGANDSRHGPVDIAQRRADSIRLQALGQIGGA
jgi:hypothetical protein